jgi:hypothetical protein
MSRKILYAALIFSMFLCPSFSQENGDVEVYDVAVLDFRVDEADRAGEVARAQYVFDYDGGVEELYLYKADDTLLEHLTLSNYTIGYQDYDYEELSFSSVEAEKLSVASGSTLKAVAEYDWSRGAVYWLIYDGKTDKTRIEVEFRSDSMALDDGDYYDDYDDYDDYDEIHSEAVEVSQFRVDGVDRTADVKSAEYRYSYGSEAEELYLYDGKGELIEHIVVSDYELETEEDDYEELYFYAVDVEKMRLAAGESLEAYAEYNWDSETVYWEIYDADTGRTRIEVTFW